MSYSDLYFQSKKRTSVVLVVCAILSIAGFAFLMLRSNSTVPSRASNRSLKVNYVANLGGHEASIYWQSDKAEVGWIAYGTTPDTVNTIVLDDRDVETQKNPNHLHFVSIKGLKENTQYYYKIISGNDLIAAPDGGPFGFRTTSSFAGNSSLKPAYGKIITPNGEAVQNAIVIVQIPQAFPLITLTKLTGEWLIPLQYAVNQQTNKFVNLSEKDVVKVTFMNDEKLTSVVDAKLLNTNPMPQTLVLGKNYTFLQDNNVLPASTQLTNAVHTIDIIYPREGSIIPGNNPLIKGVGIPGNKVKISINATPTYIFETTVGTDGSWRAGATGPIAPGYYTMIVKTTDKKGALIQVSRRFTIGKSGEQVLGDATPSASLTPTNTPTTAPITSVTVSVSPTDTATPTPTTILATSAPTASPTGLLKSGFDINPVMWSSMALIVIGMGVLLLF
jgi:hypothetical protein